MPHFRMTAGAISGWLPAVNLAVVTVAVHLLLHSLFSHFAVGVFLLGGSAGGCAARRGVAVPSPGQGFRPLSSVPKEAD